MADLLAKLDEEIQTLIEEHGLEDENGQADLVQERIDLAIIKLDTVNPIILKSFKVSYFRPYSILASFKVGRNRFKTLGFPG